MACSSLFARLWQTYKTFYRALLIFPVVALLSHAQLIKWGEPVPRRPNPPVLLVAGHISVCENELTDEFYVLTFGKFDQVIARTGRVVLYFEPCYVPNRPPVEDLAAYLGGLIERLRYEDGEPVTELDVVAHSLGGLIVRSYLAGKASASPSFAPPSAPRIRKAIFIATPHFGTGVAGDFDVDPQVREMALGSSFLFDMATWNQGADDLRGVDALSIIGTAGTNGDPGFTDSVVVLTSASLGFVAPERTIILPLCHTFGGIGALFLCPGAIGLARVEDERHPTARIVMSFLDGTADWKNAGTPAAQNAILSGATALIAQLRTADDEPVAIKSANLRVGSTGPAPLNISSAGIAYGQRLTAGAAQITLNEFTQDIQLRAGGGQALILKPGPFISGVEPAPGPQWPLALAPRMRVTIRGRRLNNGEPQVTVNGIPATVVSVSNEALDVVLPERISGLAALMVQNSGGRHTTRIYVEPAMPALFRSAGGTAGLHAATGSAVTDGAPAQPNEIISIFLTGLGDTDTDGRLLLQPVVIIGGASCGITYAGRAPGLPGIDQINCRVPGSASGSSEVIVTSGNRRSTSLLPVR